MKTLFAIALVVLAPLSIHAAEQSAASSGAVAATSSVNIGFADALEGPLWSSIVQATPEHALMFVALRDKFRKGVAVDLRDWHTVTMFKPTPALVDLIAAGDPDPAQMQQHMLPLERNQVLKVEARARKLDDANVQLNLTTVLESASSPTEKTAEPLSSRTYYLTRIDHEGPLPKTTQGDEADVFELMDAEDLAALAPAE